MKRALPIVFCIPTVLSWILFLYSRVAPDNHQGQVAAIAMPMVGLSFLACSASIAMVFVTSGAREWRFAAIFTSVPFLLLIVFLLAVGPGLA